MILSLVYETHAANDAYEEAAAAAQTFFSQHTCLSWKPTNSDQFALHQEYKKLVDAIPPQTTELVQEKAVLIQIFPDVAEFSAVVRNEKDGKLVVIMAHQIISTEIQLGELPHAESEPVHNQSPGSDLRPRDDTASVRSGILSSKANTEKE